MMQVRPSIIASSYDLAKRKHYSVVVRDPVSILKKHLGVKRSNLISSRRRKFSAAQAPGL